MTNNNYINQLASSLSESVLNLAKVGYADQFIANGTEAYRGGEEIARKVAGLLPAVRANRHEFTAYFDDPSGRIVGSLFDSFLDYETQQNLSHLARDYFNAVRRFEEWAQEVAFLGKMLQDQGAALALASELQRLLRRRDKTGKTLRKLHQKGRLELFVDMTMGPKWWLLGGWEDQYDAKVNAAVTEARCALNATMRPFSKDVVARMFLHCFHTPAPSYAILSGDRYAVETSFLPSTWEAEKELKKLLNDVKRHTDLGLGLSRDVNSFSQSLLNETRAAQKKALTIQKNLRDQRTANQLHA